LDQRAETLFALSQRGFRTLTLSDVANDADENVLAGLDKFTEGDLQRHFAAASMQSDHLNCFPVQTSLTCFEVAIEAVPARLAHSFGHQLSHWLPYQFGTRIAEEAPSRPIDKDDAALLVNRDDRFGGRLSHGSMTSLALAQRRLYLLALGDVCADDD